MVAAADAWIFASTGTARPSAAVRDSILHRQATSAAYMAFGPDIDRYLGSLEKAERELSRIDSFPSRIFGVISPYQQSVMVADTVILVALNPYLGADYPGYSSFPLHIRRLKSSDRLPLDVAEAWTASVYPFADDTPSPTVAQEIAWQGAVLANVADMLGIDDGAFLMGWTDDEWNEAVMNEGEAWRRLVGQGLLFSDNPETSLRLTGQSPSTPDISPDAPGRLGRFIGLRMVRATGRDPADILASRDYLSPSFIEAYARLIQGA